MESNFIQYAPYNSSVDASFWQTLTQKKLNEFGLDESPRNINGFFSNANAVGISPQIMLEYSAFNKEQQPPPRHLAARGILINTNTLESFKNMDKKKLLNDIGKQNWDQMNCSNFVDPESLCQFVLLTFADLKKYNYYYWFAFPALKFPERLAYSEPQKALEEVFTPERLQSLVTSYESFQKGRSNFATFCVMVDDGNSFSIRDLSYLDQSNIAQENLMLGVCDASSVASYPGWPVRSLITWAACKFGGSHLKKLKVVCIRDRIYDGNREFGRSLLLTVDLENIEKTDACPECVGWEKNERGKMGPRLVNLSSSMDPVRLAESAVDLNLRLMRWRLLPDLKLDQIGATKCLLLGSGTLGCNVARLLMGWGIRHITMVDNSKVSYSNPVRQSLFTFDDCLNGGKPKALAASDSLKKIFPGMVTEGISLSIPMPGHSVIESTVEDVKKDVQKLEELIGSHDAVFLLMDTRESRWLPSIIAAAKQKIVINAALGFDSFLVLRHGMKTENSYKDSGGVQLGRIPGDELGCYFCNDVVAPGNSTRDRSLDQQCTVTRPGVSMIAASLAVELLVSLLQHPQGGLAEADTVSQDSFTDDCESSLGLVPHQIRGFLSRFQQILPATKSFNMCTACSSVVLDSYKKEGFDFLLRAFNDPDFLEQLTGLTSLHDATINAEIWNLSDDEEFGSGPSSMETA